MRKLIALACLAALGGCVIVTPGPGVSYASSGFGSDVVLGNGVTAREERHVASVTGLEVGGVAHVDVRVGPAPSLVVEADSNLLPQIRTVVRGDRLVIGTEGAYRTRNPIHIIYTVPHLTDLHVGGAGRINVTGLNGAALKVRQGGSGAVELAGDVSRLDVDASGAGRFNGNSLHARSATLEASGSGRITVGDIQGDYANVNISGAGSVSAAGAVRALTVRVSGSGNANLDNLSSEQADLVSGGSGSIGARVTRVLLAQANGSGGVRVYGNPAQRNVSGRHVRMID
jgi:hypothetical protein